MYSPIETNRPAAFMWSGGWWRCLLQGTVCVHKFPNCDVISQLGNTNINAIQYHRVLMVFYSPFSPFLHVCTLLTSIRWMSSLSCLRIDTQNHDAPVFRKCAGVSIHTLLFIQIKAKKKKIRGASLSLSFDFIFTFEC